MTIRDHKLEDKEIIIKFFEMQTDELLPFDPFGRQRNQNFGLYSYNNLVTENEGKNKILVAEENNNVIGYVSGWVKVINEFKEQTGAPNTNGMLDNLFVLPEFRRKGVAKALVTKLEEYFRENNCDLIWLNVYSGNIGAVNFYLNFKYVSNSTTFIKKIE